MLQELFAWLWNQIEGFETPQAFAVARSKAADERFWRYYFVVTHSADGSLQAVFERHRMKGDRERLFSEVVGILDLNQPLCQSLAAIRAYYALANLANNVRQGLSAHIQPQRVRKLIHQLLLL